MGFIPLDGNTKGENDIPLTPIKSNSSTGARKPNQALESSEDGASNGEKHGLFHRHAGRRKLKEEGPMRQGSFGDEPSVNAMGRLYSKIINFSVVTRYLIYVLPIALLLIAPLVTLRLVDPNEKILVPGSAQPDPNLDPDDPNNVTGPSLFRLFLWIMITWLSLWASKIVSHFLPAVFMFFCGVVSSGTRKYATVLRALEIPLSFFIWAMSTWLTFRVLFRDFLDPGWAETLHRILGALFVSSGILLAEKTVVQLISITYHQRSFANRIKESKREVFLLGLMYDASRTLFPMYCPEFSDEDYIINDSLDMMLTSNKKGHERGGSGAPMRIIGDVGRFGDKLTSVFGNIASEITGKQVFNPNSAHSIVVEALEKATSSEALAKRIWMSFVVEGNEVLFSDDLVEVLGPGRKEEAEECFGAIDADENGDISLDEMIRKVLAIGKERKDIANSMKDISQALTVFDKVLLFVVLLIVIIVFLIFFQSSVVTNIAAAATALLSLSFVFAVTAQEFLGSCIFLFVKHPFDVGDRVDIRNGPERQQLQVEKISLLYTVFTRIDLNQLVQIPNIVLNALWIENISRAKNMKETIDLNVSFDTTFEDIELLRQEMEKFVRHPDNARDFQQEFSISCGGVGDLDKLNLKIGIKHKSNWHNDGVRAARRSKFMCALALALKRVPMYGPGGGSETLGSWKNPQYSVQVPDETAKGYRKVADEDKEGKRMVPTPPKETDEEKKDAEEKAVAELTSRSPVLDADDDWGYDRDEFNQATGHGVTDDKTLTSRNQSRDRTDSTVVGFDLHKRESKSGRRRAGDTVPLSPVTDSRPGIQVTLSSPSPSRGTFDEEAQMGANPYRNREGSGPYDGSMESQSGYSTIHLGGPESQPPQLPHIQTSAGGSQLPHGARHRGQSIGAPNFGNPPSQQPPPPGPRR